MLKIIMLIAGVFFISGFLFINSVKAEEIHFDNNIFVLKYSQMSPENKGYENEYFLKGENRTDWTKMVGIYYFPEITKPLKFAESESKRVEMNDTDVLLKFIANKKSDKAALSYLENGFCHGRKYFEYNIYKYEKHPTKGMMTLRYAERYFFEDDEGIKQIGTNVREKNDEYLEKIIISPIPQIVEKDING